MVATNKAVIKFEPICVENCIIKEVAKNGTAKAGKVYVPEDWIGKKVIIALKND